ncbi:phosphonate metabolism protein/1,5-bisphosphokinase (PRPP-forming) PhnN [Pseudohoeflea suaedae]|uniref:ribose 1,5-bisphosphate phosphokinase n=1 Tax=Pseudohoeflea suaedae TaxID=877384 RepID=A0A4R5PLK7_9HYPH|nr:phosphonate metabolism protein/1,5-bisphosphokinase (PRPP-forming) PhnN [Pseudohoeflea suaedae]TDH36228.1 phosphonate metabolism protein/1,5-bisphosphokinase (PRPP-forming) PhnN [Pseudohoeflea suaedae]
MEEVNDIEPASGGRRGCLIVIMGPSGAGKDSILSLARDRLEDCDDILFVRRSITRPLHEDSEDFEPLNDVEFDAGLKLGRFCFHWQANGLSYALPITMVDHLARGGVAVVNGSRAAYRHMHAVFAETRAVLVRVEPSVLKERLRCRGREDADEIEARIERSATYLDAIVPDAVIDNSGSLEEAAAHFVDYVMAERRARV